MLLPLDVFRRIVAYLDPGTLAAVSETCRDLNEIALPRLFRHVIIKHSDHVPLARQCALLSCAARPRLRLAVQSVDLHAHTGAACADAESLGDFQNLRTLRVFLDTCRDPSIHDAPDLAAFRYGIAHEESVLHIDSILSRQAECGVQPLRPRRIVVRNASLLFRHWGLQALPPLTYDTLEELVVVCGPDAAIVGSNMKTEQIGCSGWGLVDFVPPKVKAAIKRYTIVFYTSSPDEQWRPQPRPINRVNPAGHIINNDLLSTTWVARMLSTLAVRLAEWPVAVDIVNAGALDRAAVHGDAWDPPRAQDKIERYFRRDFGREAIAWHTQASEDGAAEVDEAILQARIRFMSMNDWLGGDDWDGVLDLGEVQTWLE